jgi:hypothetical protein
MISSGPNSFSILLRRKLELPENFLGSSNLCTPGQIDLKAKIGFQNSLAQIEFTEGCAPGQIEFVLKAKIGFQNSLGQIEFTEGRTRSHLNSPRPSIFQTSSLRDHHDGVAAACLPITRRAPRGVSRCRGRASTMHRAPPDAIPGLEAHLLAVLLSCIVLQRRRAQARRERLAPAPAIVKSNPWPTGCTSRRAYR